MITWLASIFALGTVWFFIFTGIWIILLFYCVEKEFVFWSGFNIVLYFLFFQIIVRKDVFGWIAQNPTKSFLFLLGYILIGFIWSFIKWWLFVNKKALQYKIDRFNWLTRAKEHGNIQNLKDEITIDTPVPSYLLEEWRRHSCLSVPKVIDHKKTISHWVIVKIRFLYDNVTKNAFKGTEELTNRKS